MGFSWFRRRGKQPVGMLPDGWHFFARPTDLEPPGTIFRIDDQKRRFTVDRLAPTVDSGPEPGMRSVETIDAKVGLVARLLGLEPLGAEIGGGRSRTVEFELTEPILEATTDVAMDKVLVPYLPGMRFKPGNRYFIVRSVRSASSMTYQISSELLGELGGQAAVNAVVGLKVKASAGRQGVWDLVQEFPKRLAVMFLPEEIAPTGQELGGGDAPQLGRVPVTRPLEWIEGDE